MMRTLFSGRRGFYVSGLVVAAILAVLGVSSTQRPAPRARAKTPAWRPSARVDMGQRAPFPACDPALGDTSGCLVSATMVLPPAPEKGAPPLSRPLEPPDPASYRPPTQIGAERR